MDAAFIAEYRVPLLCPTCRKTDQRRLGELIDEDQMACRFCGAPINLTSEGWRAFINETVEALFSLYTPHTLRAGM